MSVQGRYIWYASWQGPSTDWFQEKRLNDGFYMILPFYPHALGRFSQPLLGKPRHCSSSYNIEPYLLSDRSSPCLFSLVIPRMDHNCRIFRWLPMAHSFSHWKKTREPWANGSENLWTKRGPKWFGTSSENVWGHFRDLRSVGETKWKLWIWAPKKENRLTLQVFATDKNRRPECPASTTCWKKEQQPS